LTLRASSDWLRLRFFRWALTFLPIFLFAMGTVYAMAYEYASLFLTGNPQVSFAFLRYF
jgi:hypothetical protein